MPLRKTRQPLLAVTMGDPAGIGPEIILKAASAVLSEEPARLLFIGAVSLLREAAEELGLPIAFEAVRTDRVHRLPAHVPGRMFVLDVDIPPGYTPAAGTVSAASGTVAASCIDLGARLCLNGEADGLVTAPISKHALSLAGLKETAHTERLAAIAKTDAVEMAFASDQLKVVLATRHIPLAEVPRALSPARVAAALNAAARLARLLDREDPVIGLCGLNPHAGEEGMMGHEEKDVLIPAVETARRHGLEIRGPLPADSAFVSAVKGEVDAVAALYHDQGLIPFKLLSFGRGAQITLGLPFIRTSVDHGVALDRAGTGSADPGSLITAVKFAVRLAYACTRR